MVTTNSPLQRSEKGLHSHARVVRLLLTIAALTLSMTTFTAQAQDVFGAVLNGSLVKPQVGAWAWYNLTDTANNTGFVMRLAIVGSEKVKDKDGYWLEIQVVPNLGYEMVYKLLLTGPAKDPENIHKLFLREGTNATEEVPVSGINPKEETKGKKKGKKPAEEAKPDEAATPPDKSLVGTEEVKTADGAVSAQHYTMTSEGKNVDVWLNDTIAPLGVVQLKSALGTLVLRNNGIGGPNADSIIDKPAVPPDKGGATKVDVHVEKSSKQKADEASTKEEAKP